MFGSHARRFSRRLGPRFAKRPREDRGCDRPRRRHPGGRVMRRRHSRSGAGPLNRCRRHHHRLTNVALKPRTDGRSRNTIDDRRRGRRGDRRAGGGVRIAGVPGDLRRRALKTFRHRADRGAARQVPSASPCSVPCSTITWASTHAARRDGVVRRAMLPTSAHLAGNDFDERKLPNEKARAEPRRLWPPRSSPSCTSWPARPSARSPLPPSADRPSTSSG